METIKTEHYTAERTGKLSYDIIDEAHHNIATVTHDLVVLSIKAYTYAEYQELSTLIEQCKNKLK